MMRRKRDAEPAPDVAPREGEGGPRYGWMTAGDAEAARAATWAPAPEREEAPSPAAEEAPGKQPFWKRDLSVRGRRDAGEAQPEEDEKPRKRRRKERKRDAEPAERTLFWKRELSLGRKERETEAEAELDTEPQREPRTKARRQKPPKGGRRGKQLVGLKVGASQLAAARVVSNGRVRVTQLAREPLERGIVVGGELRDPDALAEALKAFFERHKLPKRNVRLGLANNRIGVRTLEVLGIDDQKQLANAIRFRAQEVLPIPIEDTVLDYQVLEEGVTDEGESLRRILLVVAYRELVDRYVEACRRAGIRLAGIDLEAFALLRALGEPRGEDAAGSAVVAVAVGHDRTTLAVSNGRTCEFTRVLEWGGHALDVAVARTLDLAPSAAEPLKRTLSLHGAEAVAGLTAEQAEAAREAMRKQVNAFARELVSSLQFYQGQPDSLPIAGITLTGGTSHLGGLAQELRRLIGVPVEVGDPLGRAEVGKKVREDEQLGSLAIAVGLGIED